MLLLRRPLHTLTIVSCVLVLNACAPKGYEDPQVRALYTANQIALRVDRLAKATAAAEAQGAITVEQARPIMEFSLSAQKTLQASPNGWYPTVSKGWAEVKRLIPMDQIVKNATLQTAFAVVDALIIAYGEEQPIKSPLPQYPNLEVTR